jgi:phospholipid/cholesterol/gamma-HCH transport system ATP-binding protein
MTSAVASADPVVSLRHVHKAFGDHVVYRDMSLDFPTGSTTTIIGASGSGKSVCMKMIVGLVRADRGTVLVHGRDVGAMGEQDLREVRRRVAYVFQGGALFDSLSVEGNVAYGLHEHADLGPEAVRTRVVESLGLVGLGDDLLEEMPANLSGGTRKRVALARSIALRPEVILYDEPTTGLDPKNIAHIGDMILSLQRELSVTSIVVTHDMPMAFKVSDRIAMLSDFAFPFVGPPAEVAASAVSSVRDFVQGRIDEG